MKIAHIEIGGVSYSAALPLQVLCNLEERTGKNAGDALDDILGAEKLNVRDLCWLLAQMLAAGAKLEEFDGPVPTENDLLNKYGLDDLSGLLASVMASVKTAHPRLEAEPVPQNTQKKTGIKAAIRALFG